MNGPTWFAAIPSNSPPTVTAAFPVSRASSTAHAPSSTASSEIFVRDANAAFMQGRIKVAGNMAKLMALMPLTNAPEYKELQKQIQEMTEY